MRRCTSQERCKWLEGVLVSADDCILFVRARIDEWRRIQEVLKIYGKASGQFLNEDKIASFFSSNTKAAYKKAIKEARNSFVCGTYEKYLGLPTMVGISKFITFWKLKERI